LKVNVPVELTVELFPKDMGVAADSVNAPFTV
jgi:hypothetical protein